MPLTKLSLLVASVMPSDRPLLTPYELEVVMKTTEWRQVYPMDYYAQAAGPWANYPRNAEAVR